MIKITLQIKNPCSRDFCSKINWYKAGKLTKNKSWEIQLWRGSVYELFNFDLDLSWRGHDHAGPSFLVGIFGLEWTIKIYDNRHWNYKKGTWQTYV